MLRFEPIGGMAPMTAYEQLARRYCALLGEDPDERIDGLPVWRIAMGDLEAAMNRWQREISACRVARSSFLQKR